MPGPLDRKFPGLRILRKLGSGASGAVFLAVQQDLDREVALKVLGGALLETRGARERFAREARVMAEHPHPGLVPVYSARLDEDPAYFTMAVMPGGDLSRHTSAEHRLPPEELLAIGERLAEALAHLHSHGVLHRDIKPANLFRDEAGLVCLGDLGLGLVEDEGTLTATGCVVGTPNFMAPEIFTEGTYGPSTDLYALAVTLHYLATGTLPREWPSVHERVDFDDETLGVPGLAGPLMHCLRLDPADRLADARVFAETLRAAREALEGDGPTRAAGKDLAATATLEPGDLPAPPTATKSGANPPISAALSGIGSRRPQVAFLVAAGVFGGLLGSLGSAPPALAPPIAASAIEGRRELAVPGGAPWVLRHHTRPQAGRAPEQSEVHLGRGTRTALVLASPGAPAEVGLWGDAHGAILAWEEARGTVTGLALVDLEGALLETRRLAGTGWEVTGLARHTIELARFGTRYRLPRVREGHGERDT